MTGMRKIMEKCRSWCSKEEKLEEVGHVESSGGRATAEETAFASRVDCAWSSRSRAEELLLLEMQRATCLTCNLIAMGEMLAYADGRCPRCGNMSGALAARI